MDDALKRGTKRKRYEPPPKDLSAKVEGKLHHDLKDVRRAAKKAKVFETQKLVKKLKGLRQKGEDSIKITEAESELEALKVLDHDAVANTALKTKLNKDRVLTDNEQVEAAMSKEFISNLLIPALPGTPAAKVQHRLLSSKILAVEVVAAVEDLRNVIQPRVNIATPDITEAEELELSKKPTKAPLDGNLNHIHTEHSNEQARDNGLQDEDVSEAGLDEAGWESGTVEDEQGDDNGWESGSVNDEQKSSINNSSGVETEGEPDTTISDKKKTPKTKMLPLKPPTKPIGAHSTFLPSLSVGFVRGGSDDSDMSDGEAKAGDIDIKKNRRGQRARRAIWEKKYGRNANHKKKIPAQVVERPGDLKNSSQHSNHPRLKKGLRDQKHIKVVPQHHQEADAGWAQRTVTSRDKPTPPVRTAASERGRKEERPMHPSWEAKRKLKEKESAGIVPSQGTKIKFS